MKISHRLYLTALPAILAMFLVAGLAYWGQYAHSAPVIVVVLAAVAVITSLVLTWSNARYVARRIERLVGTSTAEHTRPTLRGVASAVVPGHGGGAPDEIDEIERVVDRLSSAVAIARSDRMNREETLERRAHDYALLLASLADASMKRIEEVRLPLHILLANHFGELNENQEEMLGTARTAAEAADADMHRLREIAELELGERPLRQDRIKPSEILEALRPMLVATAESHHVAFEIEVAPLLPAILGDRARLQDSLVTILRAAIVSAVEGARVQVAVERADARLSIAVIGAGSPRVDVSWAAAVRLVQAHDGSVERAPAALTVFLPFGGSR